MLLFNSGFPFLTKVIRTSCVRSQMENRGIIQVVSLMWNTDVTCDGREVWEEEEEEGLCWGEAGEGRRARENDERTLRRTDGNEIPESIPSKGVLLLTHTARSPRSILLTLLLRTPHTYTQMHARTHSASSPVLWSPSGHTVWHFMWQWERPLSLKPFAHDGKLQSTAERKRP